MCVIPYCLISPIYVRWVLDKISQKYSYMKFLLNNHIGEFELAIKSSINFLSSSVGSENCNFIINLFVFPEFYKLFIRENGIKLIFENVS
ncbi:hypothetical protein MXB_4902 [Myxobolus squamalis]|nr:hypothetical protein MXB_4902 [Myxobolus squamalis]